MFDHTDFSLNPIEQARRAAHDLLDLTSSNPTQQGLIFPPDVLQSASASYWQERRYLPHPRGLLAARQAIVDYYAKRTPAFGLEPDQIFLTASTSEAYGHLFSLLTVPGDNVLAPNVTYPLFQYLADLHHIELRTYELDPYKHWQIDQDSLLDVADERSRAVLLISPHNPTGMIVQQPIRALTQLGLPLICDEVFAPFTIAAPHTPPLSVLHPELPVFLLNGISKLLALPDMKLGWIALNAQAMAFAERLELINDTFLGCNSLIQTMLPTLLAESEAFISVMLARVRSNMALAMTELGLHGRLELALPDGGYYLFPRVRNCSDDEQLVLDLIQHGVLVHPGFFYDYHADCRIMLSCLTEPSVFARGIQRLADTLEII